MAPPPGLATMDPNPTLSRLEVRCKEGLDLKDVANNEFRRGRYEKALEIYMSAEAHLTDLKKEVAEVLPKEIFMNNTRAQVLMSTSMVSL